MKYVPYILRSLPIKFPVMYQNKKFENAARQRRHYALAVAVFAHLAVLAAISSGVEWADLLPSFLTELFAAPAEGGAGGPRP